jgi:uncharacterized protein (DUF2126 family)/transglutaminase-like putative cysteine protease
MRVRIQHRTHYEYGEPVGLGPHLVRLRPADHARADLLSYALHIAPEGETRWQTDPWGNRVCRYLLPPEERTDHLTITVDASFDIRPLNPFDFFVDDRCEVVPFDYPEGFGDELAPFLQPPEDPSPELLAFVESVPFEDRRIVDYLVDLNQRVAQEVAYIIREEPGIQTATETLRIGRGSCRDSARLLTEALRIRGLAARFVSGYLVQLEDEGIIPDQAKGIDHDVVDLHAWCEVYVPGAGWVGLDGTSGLLCGEGHIPLAATVEPQLAAPLLGTHTATDEPTRFSFEMDIERLGHEPRPRRPYEDATWEAMKEAGRSVDAALSGAGLTLTLGGEPTWTSREHPREPEWNTEALGPSKWWQGLRLAEQLRRRMGTGTLAMHRFGKQYPGESLPRWIMHLLWRHDGVPVWRDPELLDFAHDGRAHPGGPATPALASRFGLTLARRLGVAPEHLRPGYEDAWVMIMREMNLPPDVDPLEADLDDPEERRQLARALGQGLRTVVGYALPIMPWGQGWVSSAWSFKRRHMFLVAGDSPMGLRLPLDRLGGVPVDTVAVDTTVVEQPIAFRPPPLPVPHPDRDTWQAMTAAERSAYLADLERDGGGDAPEPEPEEGAGEGVTPSPYPAVSGVDPFGGVRTAICFEPRDGVLHVFLPPMPDSEAFLRLVTAVEDTASELQQRVRIEGYAPPRDPRIGACVVSPDPGVLEVNIPPVRGVDGYVELMEKLHDAANHSGLTMEKYQLDGRETGSGGGNHITLGGPTVVESPFITRPDLLAGVLRYVQHHPSLSYLFTGLFVGPTSQAPRIDEARHESILELELALRQLDDITAPPPPWFTDRLLRNLLVDLTGNTHRSEISMDKLYAPGALHGRQGILEFRAFEMPPHHRMAVAQALFARALVARVAAEPYRGDLVRWGTELHDKFLLPHFLWNDFRFVLEDFRRVGLPLEDAFYEPFLEHRFPVAGVLEIDELRLEVRAAADPWPVLGEELTGATLSRYVDSSMERVQVKVDGLTKGRHAVLVNGIQVPLRSTGTAGQGVAGVRFRAWQPPHCLQPHIGIHHPLRFEIVDRWGKRSLGGCRYHVWHPEGRAYDDPPLTLFEANARRIQRFSRDFHSAYPVTPIEAEPAGEQPYTLDLRRFPGDRPQPR